MIGNVFVFFPSSSFSDFSFFSDFKYYVNDELFFFFEEMKKKHTKAEGLERKGSVLCNKIIKDERSVKKLCEDWIIENLICWVSFFFLLLLLKC